VGPDRHHQETPLVKIGLIGGTGIEGKGLALRLAAAGHSVFIGSRSQSKASARAEQFNSMLERPTIQAMTNMELLRETRIAFLTVPADQAVEVISSLRSGLAPGQILVDVTVPVKFQEGSPRHGGVDMLSNAERLSASLPPGVDLLCAFKTVPAHLLARLDRRLDCDVFICGDASEAKEQLMAIVRTIPSLRPVDAGPLLMSRSLEHMTVLAIWLNRRYRSKEARYRIVGI